MSSFHIVQISEKPINRNGYITPADFSDLLDQDPLVAARADYFYEPGETETGGEALEAVRRELAPLGEVDLKRRTLTFRDKSVLVREYGRFMAGKWESHLKSLSGGTCRWWDLHRDIEDVFGIDCLFHLSYAKTSAYVLSDYVNGYLPQTVHIGEILTAHC